MNRLAHAPACPNCGKLLDGYYRATQAGARPSPGDLTICFHCLEPLEFDPDLNFKIPSGSQRAKLLTQPEIARLLDAALTRYDFTKFARAEPDGSFVTGRVWVRPS